MVEWNKSGKEIASAMIQQAEGKAGLISFGKSSLEEWSVGVAGNSAGRSFWLSHGCEVMHRFYITGSRLFGENSSQKKLRSVIFREVTGR